MTVGYEKCALSGPIEEQKPLYAVVEGVNNRPYGYLVPPKKRGKWRKWKFHRDEYEG